MGVSARTHCGIATFGMCTNIWPLPPAVVVGLKYDLGWCAWSFYLALATMEMLGILCASGVIMCFWQCFVSSAQGLLWYTG